MRLGLSSAALIVAAAATACSNASDTSFGKIEMESPFTCAQMNAAAGDYQSHRTLLAHQHFIANQAPGDKAVHRYLKDAVLTDGEFFSRDREIFNNARDMYCAKFPSSGINDAVIEAAEVAFAQRRESYSLQLCKDRDANQAEKTRFLTSLSEKLGPATQQVDPLTLLTTEFDSLCSNEPNAYVGKVLEQAVTSANRVYSEHTSQLAEAQMQGARAEFTRSLSESLVLNNDIACDVVSQRARHAAGLGLGSEFVSYVSAQVQAFVDDYYSAPEARMLTEFNSEITSECLDGVVSSSVRESIEHLLSRHADLID